MSKHGVWQDKILEFKYISPNTKISRCMCSPIYNFNKKSNSFFKIFDVYFSSHM